MATKSLAHFCLLITFFLITGLAQAQQATKLSRVGVLRLGSPPDPLIDAFRDALSKLGYVEGQNVVIELRYTRGKGGQLQELATDLVRQKVDVIVAPGGTAARIAKDATKTIPIVVTAVADPVGEGLVSSLARPGGNVTGFSNLSPDLSGKRIEILKEAFPRIARVAVLVTPSEEGGQLKATGDLARVLNLRIHAFEVNTRTDIEAAFGKLKKQSPDAWLILGSAITFEHRKLLAQRLVESRLPAILPHVAFVESGGLMSYGPNFADLYRRAAVYVDKILKGVKPADLPIEQPTKFEFVINLKTAKQMGLTIPPNVLARADRVIR